MCLREMTGKETHERAFRLELRSWELSGKDSKESHVPAICKIITEDG